MVFFFFFNDTATTEIYTLSLHDALPILLTSSLQPSQCIQRLPAASGSEAGADWVIFPTATDRKSTRLNSSHVRNLVCRLLLEKKKKKMDTFLLVKTII